MNREVAGRPRTLTAALEARIFGKVELDHDLIRWMIRHSAWLITRFRVRASGHTAYELIQQRQHGAAIVEFGEFVSARIHTTESWTSAGSRLCGPERQRRARQTHRRGSSRFRAVRGERESSRWRSEVILEVAGCPWDMRPVGRTLPPDAL